MLTLQAKDIDAVISKYNHFYYFPSKPDKIITEKFACRNCQHIPLRTMECTSCKGNYCEYCSETLFTCINHECTGSNKVLATDHRADEFEGRNELFNFIQSQECMITYVEKDELIKVEKLEKDSNDSQEETKESELQVARPKIEFKVDKHIVEGITTIRFCIFCKEYFDNLKLLN